MTGIEARDFVIDQIAAHAGTEASEAPTVMKLSWELATDLLKLRRDDIGQLSEEMFKDGVAALQKHGLFGYRIDIDRTQDGHVVEFSV